MKRRSYKSKQHQDIYDHFRKIENAPLDPSGTELRGTLDRTAYWEGRYGKPNRTFPRGTIGHICYWAGRDIREDLTGEKSNERT